MRRNGVRQIQQTQDGPKQGTGYVPLPCEVEGCPYRTANGKPFCPSHVFQSPHARRLHAWALRREKPVTRRNVLEHPKALQILRALVKLSGDSLETGWIPMRAIGEEIRAAELRRIVALLEQARALVTHDQRGLTLCYPTVEEDDLPADLPGRIGGAA